MVWNWEVFYRKLVGRVSWDGRRGKQECREGEEGHSCLTIFIENWAILKSDVRSWAATDFPAHPVPAIRAQAAVLGCVPSVWGWSLFQEASARPSSSVLPQIGFAGWTWLIKLTCLSCWAAKSGGKKAFFFSHNCHWSSQCIAQGISKLCNLNPFFFPSLNRE